MTQRRFVSLLANTVGGLVLCFLLMGAEAVAIDWPQFRGPNRDGNWDEAGILEAFPKEGTKIRWRHPVGGGFASPVVAGGRVFVFDVELTLPSARERVHCFDAKSGEVLCVYVYAEKYGEWSFVPERGAGPTSTPIVEENRIYAVGAYG